MDHCETWLHSRSTWEIFCMWCACVHTCICVCVCVCMSTHVWRCTCTWMYVCTCVHTYGSLRTASSVFPQTPATSSLRQDLSVAWSSPSSLGWPASEPQAVSASPVLGLQSAQLLMCLLEDQIQVLILAWQASMHLTNGAISLCLTLEISQSS